MKTGRTKVTPRLLAEALTPKIRPDSVELSDHAEYESHYSTAIWLYRTRFPGHTFALRGMA